MMNILLTKFLIVFFVIKFIRLEKINDLKIAIIGSGIGGSSAAYYLLNNSEISVHIFEKENRTGGRVYSRIINGTSKIDNIGASFFLKENHLIMEIINKLNISFHEALDNEKTNGFGFLSNQTIFFSLSNSKILTFFKLLYRYGLSPVYAYLTLQENLKKFQNIYSFLKNESRVFHSVREILEEIELEHMLDQTIRDFLLKEGISQKYIDEIISAFIGGIYNQHSEINAFAGFVTLAGVGYTAYSITGGNSHLIDTIITHLQNNYSKNFKLNLNYKIEKIIKINNSYQLVDDLGNISELFDYVVISCPIKKTGIIFMDNGQEDKFEDVYPQVFQVNHKTYIKGLLNPSYFGKTEDDMMPDALLSTNKNYSMNFSEILSLFDKSGYLNLDKGVGAEKVYVIQGDSELNESKLKQLFKPGFEIIDRHHWDFAYPQLVPIERKFSLSNNISRYDMSFYLDKSQRLLHLNSIETASSCMELSIISARNIAKIIINKGNLESESRVHKEKENIEKKDL